MLGVKWSIKIGRIAGIDLYLHATFLILVIWLAVSEYLGGHNVAAMLSAIGFILLLFFIIILHELGHALAARKYGIETRDITLLPIGGLARLEKLPEDPGQELVVAIAGPLVNLVIAAALFVGISIASGPGEVLNVSLEGGNFMARLMWLNVWLAFFNLLPAFPMDGGRVLRALVAMRLSRERATEIAVNVGHFMALLFGLVGIFVNPFLVFIALFIWVGADAELQQVRMTAYLHGISVEQVMSRRFETAEASAPLGDLARRIVPGFQTDYPVIDGGRLVGFIGVDELVKGLSEGGPEGLTGRYARREFDTAGPLDLLEEVVSDWQPGSGSVVAVLDGDDLIGIVTPANIGEHVMIRSAMMRR